MKKRLVKVVSILLLFAIVLTGFSVPMDAKANQTSIVLDCGGSINTIGGELVKYKNRYTGYDQIVIQNLDTTKVDMIFEFYVGNDLKYTMTPIKETVDKIYFSMPVVNVNSALYDIWGIFDMRTTVKDGVTILTVVFAAVTNEDKACYGNAYQYGEFNRDVQNAVSKAFAGEQVLINVGEMPSLTQETMKVIAAHRDIDIIFMCNRGAEPYMLTISRDAKVPTDVAYAGFDGYLVSKYGKQALDLNALEGKNQYVDLSYSEDYGAVNHYFEFMIPFFPQNSTVVVNATTIQSFTPEVMKALCNRGDLKVRVYYMKDGKEYYSPLATGSQLYEDAGKKDIYLGFIGFVSRYGQTLVSK